MSAQIIHWEGSWDRIREGLSSEKKYDRRYAYMIAIGCWRQNMRNARALGDYDKMDMLDREYDRLQCL